MQALLQSRFERSSMELAADALAYSRTHGLHALVVARGANVLHEEYAGGFDADRAHPLYSGTKSFWGVAALRARDDGLLELDEPVAQTVARWRDDPWKRRVTLRMLLVVDGRLRLRRPRSERPVLRARARDGPARRARLALHLRRRAATGIRRGVRGEARTPRAARRTSTCANASSTGPAFESAVGARATTERAHYPRARR